MLPAMSRRPIALAGVGLAAIAATWLKKRMIRG